MTATEVGIADGFVALAQMVERGVFAERVYPDQSLSVVITMPTVSSVERCAARLDVKPSVMVTSAGDVHTAAVWRSGLVEVRAVHIQDAEVTA